MGWGGKGVAPWEVLTSTSTSTARQSEGHDRGESDGRFFKMMDGVREKVNFIVYYRTRLTMRR